MLLETSYVDSYPHDEFENVRSVFNHFKTTSSYKPSKQYIVFQDTNNGWEVHVVLD